MDEPVMLDRRGNPISADQWTLLMCDPEYSRVAEERVGPYFVSTVWVGIDHGVLLDGGVPLIFETMVLPLFAQPDGTYEFGPELELHRYATEAEAWRGHDETVLVVRATTSLEPPG